MNILSSIGRRTLSKWAFMRRMMAIICAVIGMLARPRFWPRTVRDLLSRQILFTAVDAFSLIALLAVLSGISIVTQAQVWLAKLGQSEMLGSILAAVIIRELGPLLVNFVVIGRSGTAIASELANMKIRHETIVLDSQGVDPMIYLVLPRVIGIVISVLCLTVLFSAISLMSGYVIGVLLGITKGNFQQFVGTVAGAISPKDVLNFLAKTLVPGLTTGALCCMEGLGVHESITEVPQATTRAVVKSIAAVLIVSAIVSILTYA